MIHRLRRVSAISIFAAAGNLLIAVAAHAQYNPVDQFDHINNPAQTTTPSVWQYGYRSTLTGALTLYDDNATVGTLPVWRIAGDADVIPAVGANQTNSIIDLGPTLVGPQEFSLHPGSLNADSTVYYSVLRFVAPTTGTYSLSAVFSGESLAGTSTDVHVIHNLSSIYDGIVLGFGAQVTYNGPSSLSLQSGDVIEYVVGSNGPGFSNDATGLVTTINLTGVAAPEPASLALLGITAMPIARLVRRRKV